MRDFGFQLGQQLRAGDYVVLIGELGAGKTTFTQGLGAGLDVQGSVTSPTFVVSRIHRPNSTGPELIHIDAYRLTGAEQLFDLDLEDHPNSVIVLEWGAPYINSLTDSWLQIDIDRSSEIIDSDPAAGDRVVTLSAFGERWKELDLAGLA